MPREVKKERTYESFEELERELLPERAQPTREWANPTEVGHALAQDSLGVIQRAVSDRDTAARSRKNTAQAKRASKQAN